jgi:hypothetical protein
MKSSYASPNALLSASTVQYQSDAAGRGGARDFSQPVYTPWRSTTPGALPVAMVAPAEFLQALRFVKGSPLTVTPGPTVAMPTMLSVSVQRDSNWTGDADNMVYTDIGTTIYPGPSETGGSIPLPLARLGLRVTGLKIDSAVAPSASRDPSAWRVAAASNRLLMAVDATVGGAGTLFPSLSSLATSVNHVAAATASLDDDAIDLLGRVSATGRGCGEGVHALVGNAALLSKLAKTPTAKTNGSCGWRVDRNRPEVGVTTGRARRGHPDIPAVASSP